MFIFMFTLDLNKDQERRTCSVIDKLQMKLCIVCIVQLNIYHPNS